MPSVGRDDAGHDPPSDGFMTLPPRPAEAVVYEWEKYNTGAGGKVSGRAPRLVDTILGLTYLLRRSATTCGESR